MSGRSPRAPRPWSSFTAEWNRAQGARSVEPEGKDDELERLEKKIGNLVSAVAESGGSAAVYAALKEAEARKAALVAELATMEAPAPRLLPNLGELYRAKVAALQERLAGRSGGASADPGADR